MKRALLAVLPAVLALGLVACGDDDDSPTTAGNSTAATVTNTTTPSVTDDTISGDQITLPGGGTIPDLGSILPGGSLPDLSDILPGGSLPDISIPDLGSLPTNAEEILRSVFPKLTDDQLNCLVDNLGGQLDPTKVPALIQECDISPSDLIPG